MKNSNTQKETSNKKSAISSNNEVKNAASKSQFEKNIFSSADLWKIQKMSKTGLSRRRALIS
jgi:hypothetical protein